MDADSHMHRAMARQPAELSRLLADEWDQARRAVDLIGATRRITLTGVGSSHHAALVGAWLFGSAGVSARAVSSFDLARYPDQFPLGVDDVVIVLSHTGAKRYPAEALARAAAAGATVIAVAGFEARLPGALLTLRTAEQEQSTAYTVSYLAALTVLAQTAIELGERRNAEGIAGCADALAALPDLVGDVLAREADIEPIARYALNHQTYVVGAGPNEATALEAVTKTREAAYSRIDGLAAEQFVQGPMAALNANDLLLTINVQGNATDRTAAICAVGAALGARLWIIGEAIDLEPATTFALPVLPEILSPLLTVVPVQMLARQMAAIRGVNPDRFRRDDERYDHAFSILAF